MAFYVPGFESEEKAEEAYQAMKKFSTDQIPHANIVDRRIEEIEFTHNSKVKKVKVGSMEPDQHETVLAIFEGDPCIICTENRGGARGFPMIISEKDVYKLVEFKSWTKPLRGSPVNL